MRSRLPSTRLIYLIVLLLVPVLCQARNVPNQSRQDQNGQDQSKQDQSRQDQSRPDASAGPYAATVLVPDSSAAQRNHAFEVALTKVLTRTAERDLSEAPDYGSALGKASDYVSKYQYRKDAQTGGFFLQVGFDPAAIHALVRQLTLAPASGSSAGQTAQQMSGSGTLWIAGIQSANDMARLIAGLRDDAQVLSVQPVQAGGDGVMLRLNARVSMDTLVRSLISRGVLASNPSARAGADASARWVR